MAVQVVAAYVAIAAAVAGAYMQHQAGQNQKVAMKGARHDEQIKAREREIGRRQKLLRVLATQNVNSAASGVAAFEGSPANLMKSDMRVASLENLTDRASTQSRVQALRLRGQAAAEQGTVGAGISLLDSYARFNARG